MQLQQISHEEIFKMKKIDRNQYKNATSKETDDSGKKRKGRKLFRPINTQGSTHQTLGYKGLVPLLPVESDLT